VAIRSAFVAGKNLSLFVVVDFRSARGFVERRSDEKGDHERRRDAISFVVVVVVVVE
jgi:hypothetical protein